MQSKQWGWNHTSVRDAGGVTLSPWIHWSHCCQPSAGTSCQCRFPLAHLQGINTPESLWKGHSRPGTSVLSLAHRWGQAGPVTVATRHPPQRGGGGLATKAHKSQIVLPCYHEGLAVVA